MNKISLLGIVTDCWWTEWELGKLRWTLESFTKKW